MFSPLITGTKFSGDWTPTFELSQTMWHMIKKTQYKIFSKLLSIQHVKSILKNVSFGFGPTIRTELPETVAQKVLVIRVYLLQTVSHNQLHLPQNHTGSQEAPAHLESYETEGGRGRDYLIELHVQTHLMSHSFLMLLAGLTWPDLGWFYSRSRQRHAPWRGCWRGTEDLLLILE